MWLGVLRTIFYIPIPIKKSIFFRVPVAPLWNKKLTLFGTLFFFLLLLLLSRSQQIFHNFPICYSGHIILKQTSAVYTRYTQVLTNTKTSLLGKLWVQWEKNSTIKRDISSYTQCSSIPKTFRNTKSDHHTKNFDTIRQKTLKINSWNPVRHGFSIPEI